MFGLMLQKLWHKKWMNICLFLGCALLMATVVSFPLYRSAAYDRMLVDEFDSYITTNGKWPTLLNATVVSKKDKSGETIKRMEELPSAIYSDMQVDEESTYFFMNLAAASIDSDTKRKDAQNVTIKLASIDNVEDHIKIIAGDSFSESGFTEDGAMEVIISQSAMVDKGLLLGESFTFTDIKYSDGTPLRVYIKGVYDAKDENTYFWQTKPEKLNDTMICRSDVFREKFSDTNAGKYTINIYCVMMFKYDNLSAGDVDRIVEVSNYYTEDSAYKSVIKNHPYSTVIEDYQKKISRISATLIILQIPVLVMLAAFLFMISGQMYEMEKNEISVIKSRGSSSAQIVRLYLYQSFLIAFLGGASGFFLGAVFAKILGATRNFLEFNLNNTLDIKYTSESFIYAAAAFLVCLLSITIPSFKHSRVSIVKLKQSKAIRKKGLWEKLFLDIILLGLSLYGYYSFRKNGTGISGAVMSGESLDPLLYISSSLFILGAGLFFLRIQPLIVKLIYLCGKKFWKPASYVSFMDNIKNGRKQQLIMLFLIMTISLGMYHATVARTILDNAVENAEYLSGTDVIVQEVWTEILDMYGNSTGDYLVPDYTKYNSLDAARTYTKVIYDGKGYIGNTDRERTSVTIMGINTKEFGAQTMVKKEFIDDYYYTYLNDLSQVENGVLLSKNFSTKLGYKEGDSFSFTTSKKKHVNAKIVGFIDYFPGYAPVEKGLNPDGTPYSEEKYLVVAQFDYLNKKCGTIPYEIWIGLKDGYTGYDVYNWAQDNDITFRKFTNRTQSLTNTYEDPLLQGTNGVLTMGFVVTILLCAVGYLIYWVMSIKERELMFGILRATGLHKGEIFHMLVNEQIFSGLFSVFAGIGIGKLTSKLFVPILQNAYASENQALPMRMITVASDMYRLYGVIAVVMVTVLVVLAAILFKMNVTKALKLGEE